MVAGQQRFTLEPLAVVDIAEQGRYFVKLRGGTPGDERTVWMPIATVQNWRQLKTFIAEHFGYATDGQDPILAKLTKAVPKLARVIGTSRLGWTPRQDAFIYGSTVFDAISPPTRQYEFVAPEGTLLKQASQALDPKGSRDEQYSAFKRLWDASADFKLVLALATISPFLEIVGAPPIAFHLAGPTGLGKTTLLRLGNSAFADPDSPLTKVDLSKDTQNYADAQLGILHNFPLLLDETTLRDPKQLAEAAYNIAVGRTKGRLGGPEQNYQPAESLSYTLVCFLSGEVSIREEFDHRGGAARLIELVTHEPLLPKNELPKWFNFSRQHWGSASHRARLAGPGREGSSVQLRRVQPPHRRMVPRSPASRGLPGGRPGRLSTRGGRAVRPRSWAC
jgi:hypothetical protein